MPTPANFRLESGPVPEPGDGQFVIAVQFLSVDPYMRGRMKDAASYAAPIQLGELITGGGVGRVIASRNPRYEVGDSVMGDVGWQTHCLTDGKGFRKVDPSLWPRSVRVSTPRPPVTRSRR